MKALSLLRCLMEEEQQWGNTQFTMARYDEAIAELEVFNNDGRVGCKHYLSDNGNFPLYPCVECARFYADKFERKEDEN